MPEIAGTSPQVAAETSEAADVLSPDAIKNMSFQSEWIKRGSAKLSDGEYREPAAPGSVIETVIKLTDFIAFGELNDRPVAAVVRVTEPGGSGTFYDLALVAVVDGNPVNVASASLGDRSSSIPSRSRTTKWSSIWSRTDPTIRCAAQRKRSSSGMRWTVAG